MQFNINPIIQKGSSTLTFGKFSSDYKFSSVIAVLDSLSLTYFIMEYVRLNITFLKYSQNLFHYERPNS